MSHHRQHPSTTPLLHAAILAATLLLAACAHTGPAYRPIVDLAGKDPARYELDLRGCQQYAEQLAGAASQAAIGAAVGAIAGAAITSLLGGSRTQRNQNSALGAISGGTGAGVQGETDQRNVIRRCLAGRGYSVLQ